MARRQQRTKEWEFISCRIRKVAGKPKTLKLSCRLDGHVRDFTRSSTEGMRKLVKEKRKLIEKHGGVPVEPPLVPELFPADTPEDEPAPTEVEDDFIVELRDMASKQKAAYGVSLAANDFVTAQRLAKQWFESRKELEKLIQARKAEEEREVVLSDDELDRISQMPEEELCEYTLGLVEELRSLRESAQTSSPEKTSPGDKESPPTSG